MNHDRTNPLSRRLLPVLVVALALPLLFAFGPCDPSPPPTTAPSGISGATVKAAVEAAAGITLTEQPLSAEDTAAGARALYGYGGLDQITVAVYDTDARAQQGLTDMGSPTEAFQHKNVVVVYFPPADGGSDKRATIESAVNAL